MLQALRLHKKKGNQKSQLRNLLMLICRNLVSTATISTLYESVERLENYHSRKDWIFLKSKGMCFGCLFPGHLSKDCKRKENCQTCSQRRPDLLHMEKKEDSIPADKKEENCSESKEISSACVSLNNEACAYTGAREKCALAVLPVKIKSKRSDVETYAFMDPGSTASFCTEDLLRKLKLRGRRTQILLNNMGCSRVDDSKVLKTFALTDLEVCGTEEDTYIPT